MENIKNINLKDIKKNIYFLENYKIQIFINNIYIDIYDKLNNINNLDYHKTFYNLFNDKKLNNLVNKNLYEDINDNEFYFYYNYISQNSDIQYNINNSYFINILLNVLTYYIFNFNKDKIDDYINILKNNIVSSDVITNKNKFYSSNNRINLNRIYFNKNLFEEINKLNLDIKIILYNINPYNNIINDISFSECRNDFTKFYKINNIDYYIYFSLHSNSNSINKYDQFITYKEILIINCSNIEKLIDIEDDNEIKEDNKKDNIEYEKQIKELKEEIERLNKENNELKEYKNKFEKICLFLKK